jgi:2-polyprenyl-3-methyl-5-hydroxy-6-metoxy-1,4-benzoquinol methylase
MSGHDAEGPEALRMRNAWEARAESNPLYAIDAGRRHWTLDEFYARGPLLVESIVDPALRELGVDPSGLRVLELGCGMGRLFAGLAERFGEVWGIDISATMIEQGRLHCPTDATWVVGDGASLDGIGSETIDHVVSYEVFEHIPDAEIISTYLSEIKRVLRPGGTFQAQLRGASDSTRQAVVRRMPRPLRVASGVVLQRVGVLPVRGDIDTWLGCTVRPGNALAMGEQAGFTEGVVRGPDLEALHERVPVVYWLLGRKPSQG